MITGLYCPVCGKYLLSEPAGHKHICSERTLRRIDAENDAAELEPHGDDLYRPEGVRIEDGFTLLSMAGDQ